MFSSMNGRTVIVTGASRGIGRGIATVFAEAGANVLLTGRHGADLAAAEQAMAELEGVVATFVGDVSSPQACQAMAQAAVDRFGGIDVLCANAGVFPSASLAEMSGADLEQVMATNLYGALYSVQACLAELERSGRGRVILTSSITGPITGYPGWSHYGASKAAQLGFMRTAAIELAPKAITVNAVLPGNIVTEGLAELGEDYYRQMAASVPQGRLGSVADVGHAALFLASEQAGFITGQALVIDGGQTLPESSMALAEIAG
jgi:3-oxoacyl-[acyl-carrier protein] reductase